MATKNMEGGHGSLTKISDFTKHWTLLMPMFMSMSFLWATSRGGRSNNKTSSNLLHRNSLEFIPRATVKQEKLNS